MMKKENFTSYVADAMRYYALCGCPDAEALRELRAVLPLNGFAGFRDLEAVHNMLYRLEREEYGPAAVRCVQAVYFVDPKHEPTRKELTERVSSVSQELKIAETSVYKALRRARVLVALERGLRVSDELLLATMYHRKAAV